MSRDLFSTMCGLGTKFRLSGCWQAPLSADISDLVTFAEFLFVFVTHQISSWFCLPPFASLSPLLLMGRCRDSNIQGFLRRYLDNSAASKCKVLDCGPCS